MGNNVYLPTALQQSGSPTVGQFQTAMQQSPHKVAFDLSVPLWMQSVRMTAILQRAPFGPMYSAEGNIANVGTPGFWMNHTRAWRIRAMSGVFGGRSFFTDEQAASTSYLPSVSAGPDDSSPGSGDGLYPYAFDIFHQNINDFWEWSTNENTSGSGENCNYDGTNTPTLWTGQAVGSGSFAYVDNVIQTLTGEEDVTGDFADMYANCLSVANLSSLWTGSPATIYDTNWKSRYPFFNCSNPSDPNFSHLTSAGYNFYNCDLTNLASDMAAVVSLYPFDGTYRPSTALSPVTLGAPATPLDIGPLLQEITGGGAIGIYGDLVRGRVGLMATALEDPGANQMIRDRVQYRTFTRVRVTVVELGWVASGPPTGSGPANCTVRLQLKHIADYSYVGGSIFEIPQPSFTNPFITSGGYLVYSMDCAVIFNSDIAALKAALDPYGTFIDIVGGW